MRFTVLALVALVVLGCGRGERKPESGEPVAPSADAATQARSSLADAGNGFVVVPHLESLVAKVPADATNAGAAPGFTYDGNSVAVVLLELGRAESSESREAFAEAVGARLRSSEDLEDGWIVHLTNPGYGVVPVSFVAVVRRKVGAKHYDCTVTTDAVAKVPAAVEVCKSLRVRT
jgi:hypothetical protein